MLKKTIRYFVETLVLCVICTYFGRIYFPEILNINEKDFFESYLCIFGYVFFISLIIAFIIVVLLYVFEKIKILLKLK